MEPIDFIQKYHPFNLLTQDELSKTAAVLEVKEIPPGTRILERHGSASRHLYILRKGAVQLERDSQIIQILEEGECFGYFSMLGGDRPSFDVIASEEVVVYRIPEAVFRKLIDNHGFAEFFLQDLSHRLRQASSINVTPTGENLASPIGTLIQRSLVSVAPEAAVSQAAQVMRDAEVSCLIVTSDPPGIITDRDFRNRVLAEGRSIETPVREIMSQPVKSVSAETPIYGALLFMFEEKTHHLAVMDNQQIVGLVTTTDLLRYQAQSPFYLLRRIEQMDGTAESLASYALKVIQTVTSLFESGLKSTQIGRVVSTLNDTLIIKLLKLAEEQLGPPPTPYAWLVFGSEGRMEQVLLTDQDNALVYLEDSPEAKIYFDKFSHFVVYGLIEAGFPPCPGGYMASNWHYPLAKWVTMFREWVETPNPQAILETTIFFDFRVVYGKLSVNPIEEIILDAKNKKVFLAHLARTALEFQPPLGFFGQIRQKDGFIDLKKGGIAPVVGLARVYALQAGISNRSTLARLEAAAQAGTLSRQGAENLAETFRFLQWLRLRSQLDEIKSYRPIDNKIRLDDLSHLEKRYLKEAFVAVREMQAAAELHFHTSMLG